MPETQAPHVVSCLVAPAVWFWRPATSVLSLISDQAKFSSFVDVVKFRSWLSKHIRSSSQLGMHSFCTSICSQSTSPLNPSQMCPSPRHA
ncbi:hypothetical protein A0H81_03418 [Grifola frondosa]|uniref:Uncharacterized protein n=1 Tax=Grifola frondosa TaxID=5627 RepID=A0A1C7MKL9_GRIFR|nr:hypothetical protein A0H81_03418 [Grifola frondosa]